MEAGRKELRVRERRVRRKRRARKG